MRTFEFDERKSSSNRRKHGIDFVEAQALWSDPYLIEIPA
ncbi:MAG: BrnT family toxin, partial [Halioglobus sp.]|nr:BrnT family toxin [Halioglobus sp.]